MTIAFPTILTWMITSIALESKLGVCPMRSKCSVDCDNHGINANDITTGTLEPHAEPRRRSITTRQVENSFAGPGGWSPSL